MSGARTREVLDSDLDALAGGTVESSTALALWPACLSLPVGLFFALTTIEHPSPKLFAGYVAVISVTFILGLFFLILWVRKRSSAKDILAKIRAMSPFESLTGVEEVVEPEPGDSMLPPNRTDAIRVRKGGKDCHAGKGPKRVRVRRQSR